MPLVRILYLLFSLILSLILSPNLKCSAIYLKVRDFRTDHIADDSGLIHKECLMHITYIGLVRFQNVNQVRVVKV